MTDSGSPIISFYPEAFELDMNGKKADWEAIIKIPFIDEKRLLKAISDRAHLLSPEERLRNSFGPPHAFIYRDKDVSCYPSSLPGVFPDIATCWCQMNVFVFPTCGDARSLTSPCLGSKDLPGFPTLKSIPFKSSLEMHGVNIHGQPSK